MEGARAEGIAGRRRGEAGRLRRAWAAFVGAPRYVADAADRRTMTILGVELPIRATVALVVATVAILLDYGRTFIPGAIRELGRTPEALRYQSLERLVLFGLVPVAIVVFAFRDRPARYGLRLGDWRAGAVLGLAGCTLMTAVVWLLLQLPEFRTYYGAGGRAGFGDLVLTNVLDLLPAEFLLRGFLLFALLRTIGPLGLIVANVPFVFAHIGKPEIELYSTLFGGLAYGWLDWRTGSVLWSAAAHIYIVTLLVTAAAT